MVLFIAVLLICECISAHIHMEKMKSRSGFVKQQSAEKSLSHEVVFYVNPKELGTLEKQVNDRSTPGNKLYQQWLSYDEVSDLITNEEGSSAVIDWLVQHNINVSFLSNFILLG